MKRLLLVPASLALIVTLGASAPASAGCVTGAIVGGIAGHLVGHGGMGAAAGCAYGVHRSHAARDQQLNSGRSSARDYNNNRDYH